MNILRRSFIASVWVTVLCASVMFAAQAPAGWVVVWGTETPGHPLPFRPSGVLQVDGHDVTNAVALAAGGNHGLALLADGTVLGFGDNSHGQAFAGSGEAFGFRQRTNSNDRFWHFESSFVQRGIQLVKLDGQILSNITAISAAGFRSLALKADGTAVGWGTTPWTEPFRVPPNLTGISAVACGAQSDWLLDRVGCVLGLNNGVARPVAGLSNVVAISSVHTRRGGFVALLRDRTVCAVDFQGGIQVLPGPGKDVEAVAVNDWQVLTLYKDGSVTHLGGEAPGSLTNIAAVAATDRQSMALRRDGTILRWGAPPGPYAVPSGLENVVSIAAGSHFILAITTNAAVAERFRR